MFKARTCLALTLISFGTLAATVGCSGSDEVGNGGGLISGGTGGTSGASSTGGKGSVGRGGANANGGAGGSSAVTSGSLGLACTANADCGAGLTCLLPTGTDFGGLGGPGDGMCTLDCTADSDCSAAEPGSICVGIAGTATTVTKSVCFESCSMGTPTGAATTKCQGRSDFYCGPLQDGVTLACQPLCQSDAQCGTSFCSKQSLLCEKTKQKGDPVGTSCDPSMNAAQTCEAVCIPTSAAGVTPATGACVELCSGGNACSFTGTTPGGICAGLPQGSGLFDLAICEPLCACDKDCAIPGDVCQAWATDANSQAVKTALGSDGFCFPNAIGSVELVDCKGGAGGSGGTHAGGASGTGGAGGTHTGGVGGTAASSGGAGGLPANGGTGGGTAGAVGATAGMSGGGTGGV